MPPLRPAKQHCMQWQNANRVSRIACEITSLHVQISCGRPTGAVVKDARQRQLASGLERSTRRPECGMVFIPRQTGRLRQSFAGGCRAVATA